MIVFLQLTTAGVDSGPFDLYSNLDAYSESFEENVSRASLIAGYSTDVPDYATTVRITSKEDCISSVDITLRDVECDLEGYTGEITTTSTSTSTSTTTSTSTSTSTTTSTSSTTTTTTTAIPTILICDQEWTLYNLDVTKYRNGDIIPQSTTEADWIDKGTNGIGAWCYPNGSSANNAIYGKLYNGHAVNHTIHGGLAHIG